MSRESNRQQGRRSAGRKWLLAMASLLLMVVILAGMVVGFEYFARWYFRDVFQTSHGMDYFFLRSFDNLVAETNSEKFRGGDFTLDKGEAYRVVVIGDSLAYGQAVYPYTFRFPELAAQILARQYPGVPLEIINLGYPGRNLGDHLQSLSYIKKLRPDFVLYQWYVNDMDDKVDVSRFHAHRLIPDENWHSWLKVSSVTYVLLFHEWNALRTSLGLQESYTDYLKDKFRDEEGRDSRLAASRLHELIAGLQREGIEVGIVLFPQFDAPQQDYELGFLHERVLAECRRDKITCLDLRQAFQVYDDDVSVLRANPLDGHPSRLAHLVAAENIAQVFGPEWVKKKRFAAK